MVSEFIPASGTASEFSEEWHETLFLRAALINHHMYPEFAQLPEVERLAEIERLTQKLCEMSH